MNLASVIVGWHMLFFREGDAYTVPDAGTCGANAKPDPTDPAWMDLGSIESVEPNVTQQDHKLWRPAPGRLVLKDVLENMQEISFKVTTNEVGPLTVETFFRTSQKLQGAQKQFNPLSAISRRGWIHMQGYDQEDGLLLTLDQWSRVRSVMKFDGTPTKPEWEIFGLYSSLNTGLTA